MKVPLSWLKEYVDFNDCVENLAEKLTFSGIEVEGIDRIGADCAGVIVGEVRQVKPHPDADRLTVCTVFEGSAEVEVVCGAPDVKVGGHYPFAPVGSTIRGGARIKKTKLRGVVSNGMLCAEDELGISDRHEGLLDLGADCTAGMTLEEVLGPPETVLDLEITPNRPDCLSIIGIAREVAALYGTELKYPPAQLEESGNGVESFVTVTIDDAGRCPRYSARVLTGVRIEPSPAWMRNRLTMAGVRPINNIVDITNYVLLECGHPLHAFDYSLLAGKKIIVRRAADGEMLTTLDEVERKLTSDMLVIADSEKALALAGVMGGAGSEISAGTSTVLLESAYFSPPGIRHTSKVLGLVTESSYRFSRGIDCGGVEWASRRAAALMTELAGASAAQGVIDVYPVPRPPVTVSCRASAATRLLGVPVSPDSLCRVFSGLELDVNEVTGDICKVNIPSFRHDLEREVDLIEEFARIHGLDRIPAPSPAARIVPEARDDTLRAERRCRETLAGLGLMEVMNYSLTSQSLLDRFDPDSAGRRIKLPHPISADQSILRPSLLPQMIETLGRNHARQNGEAALFEFGRIFHQPGDEGCREEKRVAIGLMGPVGRTGLNRNRRVEEEDMFLWIKGVCSRLAERLGIRGISFRAADRAGFAHGRALEIVIDGNGEGILGLAHPDIAMEWRISEPVGLAECNWPALTRHVFDPVSVRPVSMQPSIQRDMALIVDETTAHEDILAIINRAAPDELAGVELFDIFRGGVVPPGQKSMAYNLTYRSKERTLTDEEANAYHERLKEALRAELRVKTREG